MAYGVSNGHITDDVTWPCGVNILASVCLGAKQVISKEVMALDRLRVRANIILLTLMLLFVYANLVRTLVLHKCSGSHYPAAFEWWHICTSVGPPDNTHWQLLQQVQRQNTDHTCCSPVWSVLLRQGSHSSSRRWNCLIYTLRQRTTRISFNA